MTMKATMLLLAVAATAVIATRTTLPSSAERPAPAQTGGSDRGVAVRMPDPPAASGAMPPLRVSRVEVHEVGEGSHAGAAGDLLLTVHGQGFLETAAAPTVQIGKASFGDTMVSLDRTQLFVVVPRGRVHELETADAAEIVVANPGARRDTAHARATLRGPSRDLVQAATKAPRARLFFRSGRFVRELAGR